MRQILSAAICFGALALAGCHAAYVEATVHNGTQSSVTLLEVDYPSASFGKETLAADEDFHYRFKILGEGNTKVLWTDAAHHEHTVAGPELKEGQEGSIRITLDAVTATWEPQLHAAH